MKLLEENCCLNHLTEFLNVLNRFVPEKFEELFTKFAKTEKSRLSFNELLAMTEANRNAVDPFGW